MSRRSAARSGMALILALAEIALGGALALFLQAHQVRDAEVDHPAHRLEALQGERPAREHALDARLAQAEVARHVGIGDPARAQGPLQGVHEALDRAHRGPLVSSDDTVGIIDGHPDD